MHVVWRIGKNIDKQPKNVFITIFASSQAGGSSVHYLTITPQTRGLFQRAIIISGSAFNKTWSLTQRINQAERLARSLGWKGKTGDESSILNFLEDVPAFELDDAWKTLFTDEEVSGYSMIIPFGPVIEPYASDNCVVSKEPVEMAREAWTNEHELVVVGNSFEGIYRAHANIDNNLKFLKNPSCFAPLNDLGLGISDDQAKQYGERIKKIYFKDGEEPTIERKEQFLRVSSFKV